MPVGEGGDALARLLSLLGDAGVRRDAEGLADALWLARWVPAAPSDTGRETPPGEDGTPPEEPDGEPDGGAHDGAPRRPGGTAGAGHTALYALRLGGQGVAVPAGQQQIGVPRSPAVGGHTALERALQPLRRHHTTGAAARLELDEDATVDLSARAGLIVPALRSARRREAGLRLLIDDSASMAVWEQLLYDLRGVCERSGAFRELTVHRLRPLGSAVGSVPFDGPGAGPPQRAERLIDPSGRQVTLLLSDCSGPLWRGGELQRLLYRWAACAPVAIVQPLPQRLWSHTVLRALPGRLTRRPGAHQPLGFQPARRVRREAGLGGRRAIPVLSVSPAAFGTWARLVTAASGLTLRGAAAWLYEAEQPARPATARPGPQQAEQLLGAFDATASLPARRLALYLSAVPLTLPVMQLVQRAMLPGSGPAELAEVLLSGLVVAEPDSGGSGPWFTFRPGVDTLLQSRLTAGEARLVLKHLSLYVERTYGRTSRNFPAVAAAYLAGSEQPPVTGDAAVPRPFAKVARQVLRRFQPAVSPAEPATPERGGDRDPFTAGRELLAAYLRRPGAQGRSLLVDAVRLLRAAAADGAGTAEHAALAEALLHHWLAWRDPDTLAEAENHARDAVAGVDIGPEPRRVLAEVLRARAEEHQSAGDQDEAADRLREAAATLRALTRDETSQGGPGWTRCAILLADVLRLLHALDKDAGALMEAKATMDLVLGRWPADELLRGRAHIARGRAQLGQSRQTGPDDAEHGRRLAARAADDLRQGMDLLRRLNADGSREGCETLLDLADAQLRSDEATAFDLGLTTLDEARELAEEYLPDDLELRAGCLSRMAAAQRLRHTRTGSAEALEEAVRLFTRAMSLTAPDAPAHAELLTGRGEALLERGRSTAADDPDGAADLVNAAIQVLRGALAETGPQQPELAARRLHFGRALRLRYELQGAVPDLFEADWILGLAARDPRPGHELRARCWLELGDVQLLLEIRSGQPDRHERAADCYRRAAEAAEAADKDKGFAARAQHRRAQVLEAVAGPQTALQVYQLAWELWQQAGEADSAGAQQTLERMRELQASG
ncbi:SAV_2336 N-terminal domain-related protein [Streptomyces sp. NPDC051940]|uniref:SAV_2336 N-terminal domain-related protein n=1 Tax=Streptomyces sp. NPDC051940 TaxID=3155675 RepID=UPI0034266FFE